MASLKTCECCIHKYMLNRQMYVRWKNKTIYQCQSKKKWSKLKFIIVCVCRPPWGVSASKLVETKLLLFVFAECLTFILTLFVVVWFFYHFFRILKLLPFLLFALFFVCGARSSRAFLFALFFSVEAISSIFLTDMNQQLNRHSYNNLTRSVEATAKLKQKWKKNVVTFF